MILLIVCVVIAAVLFLVWGVKQNKFGKYYWGYAIAFGLTILTCFIHVHQMYHWTVILVVTGTCIVVSGNTLAEIIADMYDKTK